MSMQSVKSKLGWGFGIVLALFVVLAVFAFNALDQSSATTNRIYAKNLRGLSEVSIVSVELAGLQADLLHLLDKDDRVRSAAARQRVGERLQAIKTGWEAYYPAMLTTGQEKDVATDTAAVYQAWLPDLKEFLQIAQSRELTAARAYYQTTLEPDHELFNTHLKDLRHYQVERADFFHTQSMAAIRFQKIVIGILAAIALVFTLLVTALLIRMITRPLNRARLLVESIADGRLDNPVLAGSHDEFGVVLDALDRMQTRLAEMVEKVRSGSEAVGASARRISSGSEELSSRTQEQAANLEQTAASMEQMTLTVKQNADNAAQADQLTQDVCAQAEKGGQVVNRAVESMQRIDEASARIKDIISLIENIAFQTNLLALNASVEAARAGDQGRGFAVVASEVRNLAGRSAAAAKDIKTLVEDSAAKVSDGSAHVTQSGRTLEEIVENINKVSAIVAQIAEAGKEQSSGIEQVNTAVSGMDSMTQQNAALADESAAASRSLGEQVDLLKAQVAFFKSAATSESPVERHPNTTKIAGAPAPARSGRLPKPPRAATAKEAEEEEWASF